MACEQTAELNDVTMDGAEGSDYMIMEDGIEGLGLPLVKDGDQERADDHGDVAAADYAQSRTLRIPVMVWREDDPEGAMAALRQLKTAWRTVPGVAEQELIITVPGIGPTDDALRFYGRPRGVDANLRRLHAGLIYARATFVALDPVGYGPEETVDDDGTFVVTNPGDAISKRAVVELIGNGGTPQLVNNTDGGADVQFSQTLGSSDSWFVDLATRTVVDDDGDDVFPDNVLPASLWPRLQPGTNSLTVTGAASASVVFMGGWW